MDFDTATPAVVLKLDHNVMHHGGLGVIRSLGRAGIPVYAVHEHPLAPAAHSRYLHGRFLWNPQPDRPEQVVAGLIRLAERIGRPAVLIPTDDAGAILLAEHGTALRRWFRFPEISPRLPRQVAGKFSLTALCHDFGLPTVKAVLVRDLDEAAEFAAQVGLPLVAKLAQPWRPASGFRGAKPRSTTLVRTKDELAEVFQVVAGEQLMLQEHIPGDDWFFHGYCDAESDCVPAFTGVKERSYPPHAGLTSLGRCVPNERLRSEVVGLLGRLAYRGIMDLDLRYDHRDDRYKLLDFNPRIGAQFRLFANADGLDVARAAHLDLTGRAVPHGEPVSDRRFLVENYDSLAAVGYLRRGELGLRSWLVSLRRIDETAWYARDDLTPFGLMCLRTAWRVVQRPLARTRPAAGGVSDPRFRPGRAVRSRALSPAFAATGGRK